MFPTGTKNMVIDEKTAPVGRYGQKVPEGGKNMKINKPRGWGERNGTGRSRIRGCGNDRQIQKTQSRWKRTPEGGFRVSGRVGKNRSGKGRGGVRNTMEGNNSDGETRGAERSSSFTGKKAKRVTRGGRRKKKLTVTRWKKSS